MVAPDWRSTGLRAAERAAFETFERLRLEAEHRRERPVASGQAWLADRSRRFMRVEGLRQLRFGVLEVPASHRTIIAASIPTVAWPKHGESQFT
jgi:hypothetical protein